MRALFRRCQDECSLVSIWIVIVSRRNYITWLLFASERIWDAAPEPKLKTNGIRIID